MIVTLPPRFPLSSSVECVWHYEGAGVARGREHVLPDGRFQIVLNLAAGKGAVCGLRSQFRVIDTGQLSSVIGVVFRAGGAAGFLAQSALDFRDRSVPLDLVWGPQVASLLDRICEEAAVGKRLRILEAALTDRTRSGGKKRTPMHPAVDYALRRFNHAPHLATVADVSREIGWSRRWFRHAFSEQVGMTPKRYCRIMRLQRVVRQLAAGRPVDWADVALAGGFCDQAHLVHEFRAFCGLSPGHYLTAERPFPNHIRMD